MLYIIPTPIGNLKDITLRALEVLKSASRIICEDTRQTQKLLQHYEISKPLFCFHEHSGPDKVRQVIDWLKQGEDLALVSDSGMPVVSDPGYQIVREVIREGLEFTVLPGPTAAVTSLVKSGLPCDSYTFYGFIPKKTVGRKKFFESLKERPETLIFYESPFRVRAALEDLLAVLGNREAAVVREISKKFEECCRGYLSELVKRFSEKEAIGEIVILVSGFDRKEVFQHT